MISAADILNEARISLRDPLEGGARMLRANIPDSAVWPFFLLSVVLSALAMELNSFMSLPPQSGVTVVYYPPVLVALGFAIFNFALAWSLTRVGRAMGGNGSLRAAMILIAWQQYLAFGLTVGLTLAALVLPFLSLLSLIVAGWMIWVTAAFVKVLHGFDDWGITVVVLIIAMFICACLLAFMVLTFGAPIEIPANA